MRPLLEGPELTFEQALAALRSATGLQLLAFDEQARRGRYYWQPADRFAKDVIRTALGYPEHSDAYLFYEACNGSGFIREQALRALRGRDDRLVCAAILIRIEDWVPQVADVAERLLKDVAATDAARHFFEFLDLITALRSRRRFEPHWVATLEPMLLRSKWRDARRAALSSGDDDVRLLAHQLIRRADEDAAPDTLRIAISDLSPRVALWALSKVDDSAEPALRQSLLHEGLRSRRASIRREALRRYCRSGYGDLRELLHAAIFDPAHSVRTVAAFQINALFGESALPRWREAFDRGNRGEAMVMALSESGDAQDDARLRTQLRASRGRIRALALRGLLRIGAADSAKLLDAAMRDSSVFVVGAAIAGYAFGTEQLAAATLHEAFMLAKAPAMRARLISASRLLPKWRRLQFLLELCASCGEADREPLNAAVATWIASANRTFTEALPEQKAALRSALETARSTHPARFWDHVQRLI